MEVKGEIPLKSATVRRPAPRKVRVTVDMHERLYARLEQLEELVGAESKADLIRDALRTYELLAEKAAEGYTFFVQKDDQAIPLPLFLHANMAPPNALEKGGVATATDHT